MASGISMDRLNGLSNGSFKLTKLSDLIEMGMIGESNGMLFATQTGTKLLNQVIYHILDACE